MPFAERDIFTVSEINAEARSLLEESYPEIAVLGEVSNFKRHTSGHLYFTLKDASSQLRIACFRTDAERLDFDPGDGLRVVAVGRLTIYEPYGQYQLIAHSIRKAGIGELEIAFRALCEKLDKEGLFAPEHKQPLPAFPFKIAVITSPTGAAIRDIVSTIKRRWPCVEMIIMPVHVQGDRAAPEIVQALGRLERIDGVDLVILGRGGGSLEDLWAFNEEIVARAVYACPLPVVSAVGHETDFTITDFVSDIRAATPTMAAEIAVPLKDEVMARIDDRMERLLKCTRGRLQLVSGRLRELVRSYAFGRVRGQIESGMQTLDYLLETLSRNTQEAIRIRRSTVSEVFSKLEALNPKAILERGYTICSDAVSGAVLRSVDMAARLKDMRVTFYNGSLRAEVKEKMDDRG